MSSGLPDPITKREVVYGDRPWPLPLEECGKRAQEKGQYMDALLYYYKAGSKEKIQGLVEIAVKDGNAFLLKQIENILKEKQEDRLWQELMKNAEQKGKFAYVKQAKERLGIEGKDEK